MNSETTDNDDIVNELVRSVDLMIWNLNQMRDKIAAMKIRSRGVCNESRI